MTDVLAVTTVDGDPAARRRTEFVERKGIGHPDSLCDGVAEAAAAELDASHTSVQSLSRIGSPVSEPQAVDIETTVDDEGAVRAVVAEQFGRIGDLTDDLVAGDVDVF